MNCLLWNRFLQTFDYAHRTTSLNRKQLQHGTTNKSYRILVADSEQVAAQGDASVARDFDLLDTEGRTRGEPCCCLPPAMVSALAATSLPPCPLSFFFLRHDARPRAPSRDNSCLARVLVSLTFSMRLVAVAWHFFLWWQARCFFGSSCRRARSNSHKRHLSTWQR